MTDTPNTHIHDSSLYWLCTGTSMKVGGVKKKLVLWAQFYPGGEIVQSC